MKIYTDVKECMAGRGHGGVRIHIRSPQSTFRQGQTDVGGIRHLGEGVRNWSQDQQSGSVHSSGYWKSCVIANRTAIADRPGTWAASLPVSVTIATTLVNTQLS